MVSISQHFFRVLFSDGFDPFDLSLLETPKTFRKRDGSRELSPEPFEGFRISMQQLGDDLKRGLEIYGGTNQ
jgi:hypothetical protein